MSATAGSGAERRMEESASAADNAWSGGPPEVFSDDDEEEQWMINGFGFEADGAVSFGFKIGFERFVGMVRDIFVICVCLIFLFLQGRRREREIEGYLEVEERGF